ncbi:hypothetical protein [Flavobacterium rhizosphaerae]|uniref:Uncharacterized protein n=1 Tax=Flavobacterium rhizosphaerae TaxID=3163298 RepID=A0ABW8YWL6_9FLAO
MEASAAQLKEVARQNLAIASNLESALKSALNELGNSDGRRRKAAHELSPEQQLELIASLTMGGGSKTKPSGA